MILITNNKDFVFIIKNGYTLLKYNRFIVLVEQTEKISNSITESLAQFSKLFRN